MNHSKRIGSRLLSLLLAVALVLALSVPAFAAQDSRSSADTGTLKIAVMLIAVNFALNLLFHYIGGERLSGTVLNRPVLGELILALFGLIPNCSVSVVVTESYLSGVLGLGGLFAGLLSNAGIGLLVLLRTNRNW